MITIELYLSKKYVDMTIATEQLCQGSDKPRMKKKNLWCSFSTHFF